MGHYGYFDESGNFGFSFGKPNVSTHFVVGGLIFAEGALPNIESISESIADKYFNGSEIKSSNVGSDDERRINILKDALLGDFHVYTMVFDKRRFRGSGLRRKQSFVKFLNRQAYENVALSFNNIKLVADEHGSKEFMRSFRDYIGRHFSRQDIFGQTEFGFESSKSNRVLQLADFLVGTIARCYDLSNLSTRRNDLMSLLFRSNQLLPIFEWPIRKIPYSGTEETFPAGNYDDSIMSLSIKKAEKFIADNKSKSGDFIAEQVAAVNVFLHHIRYGDRNRFLRTNKILQYFAVNPTLK
ncbi:MAG: DUF3800 domain-containing protein, partial [Bacteroidota bacterium]